MDGISVNDLFQASAFSKGYNGKHAKVFLQLLFACNMCQCFIRIYFKFGNARLYVTENSINFFTSSLYPLSTNRLISFLEKLW